MSVASNNFSFTPSNIFNAANPPWVGELDPNNVAFTFTPSNCNVTGSWLDFNNAPPSGNSFECGFNLDEYQLTGGTGQASPGPYGTTANQYSGPNAQASNSSFTVPLSNLDSNSYGGAGEAPGNNLFSGNTYSSNLSFEMYLQTAASSGTNPPYLCGSKIDNFQPICVVNFPQWQSVWQEDLTSGSNTGSGGSGSPPTVSITSPSANTEMYNNNVASSAVTATATANDGGSIASVELLVNGTIIQTLTQAPYNFNLNTFNYHDGTYTIEVLATDDQGTTNSTSQSIYIANGDLNLNHSVGLDDLAIMASNWNKPNQTYSQGNITGQTTVNISDLSVMAANWGWKE